MWAFLEGMRPQFLADGDIETYYDLDDLSEDPEFIPELVFGLVWVRVFSVAAILTSRDFQGQHRSRILK